MLKVISFDNPHNFWSLRVSNEDRGNNAGKLLADQTKSLAGLSFGFEFYKKVNNYFYLTGINSC